MNREIENMINDDSLVIIETKKEIICEHNDTRLLKDNKIIGYKVELTFYTKEFLKERNDNLIREVKSRTHDSEVDR
jgi:hypothetical protein